MAGITEGLMIAGIVGAAQGVVELVKWLVKKYFSNFEKQEEKGNEQLTGLSKQMDAFGNSLLQVRNDLKNIDVKQKSLCDQMSVFCQKEEDNEKDIRNIKEGLRRVGDHCSDIHGKDLKIDALLAE